MWSTFPDAKKTVKNQIAFLISSMIKSRFPLQPYRSELTPCISLFREHSDRTNDIDTVEYATFRNDTVEVENSLNESTWKKALNRHLLILNPNQGLQNIVRITLN